MTEERWAALWKKKARAERERARLLGWELDWFEWKENGWPAEMEPVRPSALMALLEEDDDHRLSDLFASLEPWQIALICEALEESGD